MLSLPQITLSLYNILGRPMKLMKHSVYVETPVKSPWQPLKELFINAGYNPPPTVVTYTTLKILKTKHLLQTAQASRSKKHHNSCISVTSGFGILQKIVLFENPTPECLLIITKLQPASFQLCKDIISQIHNSISILNVSPHQGNKCNNIIM